MYNLFLSGFRAKIYKPLYLQSFTGKNIIVYFVLYVLPPLCMFSRMMLLRANVLIMDEPTAHLDLESITALNTSLENFKGTLIMSSHDHELVQTVCNRIIEITPKGLIDRYMTYDEFLEDKRVKELKEEMYV